MNARRRQGRVTLPSQQAHELRSASMIKVFDRGSRKRRPTLAVVLGGALALACACCGGGASTEGQTPKIPAAPTLPACTTSDVCTDLASCLLTSKEHLEAFNCRACTDESVKACEDAKTCPVRDARSVEALVCRAIRQEMPCKNATTLALEAWRKDGEPPFLDEGILRRSVGERYARQAKAALGCPTDPVGAKP